MNAVQNLSLLLEDIRKENDEFPIIQIAILVWVYHHEGFSQVDIADRLGLTTSSASRNIQRILPWYNQATKIPGRGMLRVEMGPDRRQNLIFITEKGRRFVDRLLKAIEPEAITATSEASL